MKFILDVPVLEERRKTSAFWRNTKTEKHRGEDNKTANAASTAATAQQQQNAVLQAQQQQERAGLLSQYQNLFANAATGPDAQASAASFGSAQDQLRRRAAVTGNSAGAIEGQDQLAREKAQGLSDIVRKNELAALQGEAGIYGEDTNLLAKSLGIPVEYLQIQEKAREPKGQQPGLSWSWQNGLGFSV